MDLTAFLFLLDTQRLHFTRTDQFEDRFEGAVPRRVRERLEQEFLTGNPLLGLSPTASYEKWRRTSFVSCWHVNEYESAAMWRLYVSRNEGIAIRSTVSRLTSSFDNSEEVGIFVGNVNYIDYEIDSFADDNVVSCLLHKRKSFEHEREVRAVAFGIRTNMGRFTGCTFDEGDECGMDIPVGLNHLIEAVYVAPDSSDWIRTAVASLIQRYGLTCPVHRSSLATDPVR